MEMFLIFVFGVSIGGIIMAIMSAVGRANLDKEMFDMGYEKCLRDHHLK